MRFQQIIPFKSRSNDSIELQRHQRGKSFVNLWSSLNDRTHDELEELTDALDVDDAVTLFKRGDQPGGRSVHRAADLAKQDARQELDGLSDKLADCVEVLTFLPPGGTGMIGVETVQPFHQEPLEALTRFLVVSPQPTMREQICRAFNLATISRDGTQNVFISKASHDEIPIYPEALAQVGMTALFIDTLNLFVPAITHRTVPARDVPTTRPQIESKVINMVTELEQGHSKLLGFSPGDWLPPSVNAGDIQTWGADHYRVYLVVPQRYDKSRLTNGLLAEDDGIRITTHHAPVSRVRILCTRELASEFVHEVKTGNIRWVYENARSLDAWQNELAEECSHTTDPQEEVVRFLTEDMNVYDPDVLTALREVGADV